MGYRKANCVDWNRLLQHYEAKGRKRLKCEINWFSNQPSLFAAIRTAAAAGDERGHRYSHQAQIWETALQKAEPALLATATQIRNADSFAALHQTIIAALQGINGLGELYYYDTTLRLGAFLGLLPIKVYLHRGTRTGAINLGLDATASSLEMSDLPEALQHLLPHEAEDFLCIYKDAFILRKPPAKPSNPLKVSSC